MSWATHSNPNTQCQIMLNSQRPMIVFSGITCKEMRGVGKASKASVLFHSGVFANVLPWR